MARASTLPPPSERGPAAVGGAAGVRAIAAGEDAGAVRAAVAGVAPAGGGKEISMKSAPERTLGAGRLSRCGELGPGWLGRGRRRESRGNGSRRSRDGPRASEGERGRRAGLGLGHERGGGTRAWRCHCLWSSARGARATHGRGSRRARASQPARRARRPSPAAVRDRRLPRGRGGAGPRGGTRPVAGVRDRGPATGAGARAAERGPDTDAAGAACERGPDTDAAGAACERGPETRPGARATDCGAVTRGAGAACGSGPDTGGPVGG